MTKIDKIWLELEKESTSSQGILLRRYAGSVLPNIFVAFITFKNVRCIAALVSRESNVNLASFSNLKDINIELIPDQANSEKNILLFQLLDSRHQDIFSILCEDLIFSVEKVTKESDLIKELFNRFEKWRSLFEAAGSTGLSGEEQRGLFGELFLLRKFLRSNSDFLSVVTSWVGCERQIKDFQYKTWSIEVKTTYGNNHQKLHISSERQLDCSNLEYLILYHLSLEARQKTGETLNDVVESIRMLLQNDFRALSRFNAKLTEGRYFNHHRNIYDEVGYHIRQEFYYKVEGEFPRIEEADIRNGVGDVKYTIILSQFSAFTKTEEEVFQNINFI